MKAGGYSEADIDEASSLSLLTIRCRRTNRGWNEVEAAQEKPTRTSPGITRALIRIATHPAPVSFGSWSGIMIRFRALRTVHCPVLAIFGELDPAVPAQKSADIWKTALAEAGNKDVVIKIFPHADHLINDTRTWTTLPGVFALQRDWLLKHVTVNN